MLLEHLLGHGLLKPLFSTLRSRHRNRVLKRLKPVRPTEVSAVERRANLDAKTFKNEFFRYSQPVIFSGAAANWNCVQKWNFDYLSLAAGDNDLLIVNSQGLTTREQRTDYQFLSLRELVKNIRGGGDQYLRFSPLLHENPALVQDLDMTWLQNMRGGKTFGNTYYMFIGGTGHKTLLHADQPCNLFVQIYGEKKWTLFYPQDSICLYPEATNTAYVKSPVDIEKPDYEAYPLMKYARRLEAHLKPGDIMYIPPHVWHQVENLTDTIAVGYRYSSLAAALSSSPSFSLLRVLSTNPPVWKTRKYGKTDTNLIWAHANGKIDAVMTEREQRRQKAAHK